METIFYYFICFGFGMIAGIYVYEHLSEKKANVVYVHGKSIVLSPKSKGGK